MSRLIPPLLRRRFQPRSVSDTMVGVLAAGLPPTSGRAPARRRAAMATLPWHRIEENVALITGLAVMPLVAAIGLLAGWLH